MLRWYRIECLNEIKGLKLDAENVMLRWRSNVNNQLKDIVTSCAPTILRLQIGDLDNMWFLVLTPFGQWVHASSCSPRYLFWSLGKVGELRSYGLNQLKRDHLRFHYRSGIVEWNLVTKAKNRWQNKPTIVALYEL